MKKLIIPIVLILATLFSCELVPDLNPNTNVGADITVFVLNDTILDNTLFLKNSPSNTKSFDLDQDGVAEFEVRETGLGICDLIPGSKIYEIQVRGKILSQINTNTAYVNTTDLSYSFLVASVNSNGSSIQPLTNFENNSAGLLIGKITTGFFTCPTEWQHKISNANNGYIMIKLQINNDLYNGWIEYSSNYNIGNETGHIILKRVGIANEPGTVLRAGQTE